MAGRAVNGGNGDDGGGLRARGEAEGGQGRHYGRLERWWCGEVVVWGLQPNSSSLSGGSISVAGWPAGGHTPAHKGDGFCGGTLNHQICQVKMAISPLCPVLTTHLTLSHLHR